MDEYLVGKDVAGLQANMRNVADELIRIGKILEGFEQRLVAVQRRLDEVEKFNTDKKQP